MCEMNRFFIILLLATCFQQSSSYKFCFMQRQMASSEILRTALKSSDSKDIKIAEISTVSLSAESEAEFDRLLLENDDDDGDEGDEEADAGVELAELDINLISESEIDKSIQNAVQKLVDSGPKEPELSRVETFDNIYKTIKAKSSDPNVKMDHTSMLAALFADTQRKDPFDEKKVMMKFRTMLKNEDFENLFRDPLIGDFL